MVVTPILHNIHNKNQRVPKVALVLHPNHLVVGQITLGVPNLLAVDVETLLASLVFVMEGQTTKLMLALLLMKRLSNIKPFVHSKLVIMRMKPGIRLWVQTNIYDFHCH